MRGAAEPLIKENAAPDAAFWPQRPVDYFETDVLNMRSIFSLVASTED
jgi:hypothetical protein